MKTISVRQFAAVKRVAQNVNFAVTKKNKIAEQINALNEQYNNLVAEIEGHEAGIIKLTGHTSEELVTKVVITTDKVDKDGKPIKVTKYEPKDGFVVYNEEKKVYEIHDSTDVICNDVSADSVDDTEKAPEVEVKAGEEAPIDPITDFTQEDKDNIPFMG